MSLCESCTQKSVCRTYPLGHSVNACHWYTTEEESEPKESNPVDKPAHYHGDSVINFIEEFGFGFHIANTIKYCARADLKGKPIEDLEKAKWYLEREIARRRKEQVP